MAKGRARAAARCGASAVAQAVRPAPTTQSTRVLRLSSKPGARFAHLPVFELAARCPASQAQPTCLTVHLVSRPDHRTSPAPLRNPCPSLFESAYEMIKAINQDCHQKTAAAFPRSCVNDDAFLMLVGLVDQPIRIICRYYPRICRDDRSFMQSPSHSDPTRSLPTPMGTSKIPFSLGTKQVLSRRCLRQSP